MKKEDVGRHSRHRPSNDNNKRHQAPKGSDVTQKDLESMARAQGKEAKIEGKLAQAKIKEEKDK